MERYIYSNHIKDVENYFRLNNKMNDLLIYNIDYDTPDKNSKFSIVDATENPC